MAPLTTFNSCRSFWPLAVSRSHLIRLNPRHPSYAQRYFPTLSNLVPLRSCMCDDNLVLYMQAKTCISHVGQEGGTSGHAEPFSWKTAETVNPVEGHQIHKTSLLYRMCTVVTWLGRESSSPSSLAAAFGKVASLTLFLYSCIKFFLCFNLG